MASPACTTSCKQQNGIKVATYTFWVVSILAILAIHLVDAKDITIKWEVPANENAHFYQEKMSLTTFNVGDVLHFNYPKEFHNVIDVSEADCLKCKNTNASLPVLNSGNDAIPLKKEGKRCFICGIGDHCQDGQKLVINVGSPAPAPGPHPSGSSITIISATALVLGAVVAIAFFFLV